MDNIDEKERAGMNENQLVMVPTPEEGLRFYDRLRTRIEKWLGSREGKESPYADFVLLVPDFFYMLFRMMEDEKVSPVAKTKVAGAVIYFILPFDLMPEFIFGPMGFLDDLSLAAYVLNEILASDPSLATKYWKGNGDVLEVIRKIIDSADRMIGGKRWKKILEYLK